MPRAASAAFNRWSAPSGYGAKAAVTGGRRWIAVTIGSASRPRGAREAVSRPRTSCSERSLSPLMTGRVWEAIQRQHLSRRRRFSKATAGPIEDRFQDRQHRAGLFRPDHDVPQWLELLPPCGIGEVAKPGQQSLVRGGAARDRSPAVELAVGPAVPRL